MSHVVKVKPTPNRKYTRELLRHLPKGTKVGYVQVETGGERQPSRAVGHHPLIVMPDGELLRLDSGVPVIVCATPGDRRSLRNDVARIRRALRSRE